jgi:hypothetical protein
MVRKGLLSVACHLQFPALYVLLIQSVEDHLGKGSDSAPIQAKKSPSTIRQIEWYNLLR